MRLVSIDRNKKRYTLPKYYINICAPPHHRQAENILKNHLQAHPLHKVIFSECLNMGQFEKSYDLYSKMIATTQLDLLYLIILLILLPKDYGKKKKLLVKKLWQIVKASFLIRFMLTKSSRNEILSLYLYSTVAHLKKLPISSLNRIN